MILRSPSDQHCRQAFSRAFAEPLEQRVFFAIGTSISSADLLLSGSSGPAPIVNQKVSTAPRTGRSSANADALPAFNSLPGSGKELYLNFEGIAAFDWDGTLVHGSNGDTSPVPAFSFDGDQGFNQVELDSINDICQWVAEKYSPFDVNVTTVNPGSLDDGRAAEIVIGGFKNDWLNQNYGGIAPVGGFYNSQSNIGFVFSGDAFTNLYVPWGAARFEQFIGESVAHEAGHLFGLQHQRTGTPPAGGDPEYYGGDNTRAPIMGGSSNNTSGARGIWWRTNNFPGQNSPDGVQDDLNWLGGDGINDGVLGLRPDDSTPAFPITLPFNDAGQVVQPTNQPTPGVFGVLGRATDADQFLFTPTSSTASFSISNAPFGGMLAPNVTIYRQSDNVVPTLVKNTTNISATITASNLVPGRTYVLQVYSQGNYGDEGQYRISGGYSTNAYYSAASRTVYVSGQQDANNNLLISVEYNGVNNPGLLQVRNVINGGSATQTFPLSDVSTVSIYLGSGSDTLDVEKLSPLYGAGLSPVVNVDMGGGTNRMNLNNYYAQHIAFSAYGEHRITMSNTNIYFTNVQQTGLYGSLQPDRFDVFGWAYGEGTLYCYGSDDADTCTIYSAALRGNGAGVHFDGGNAAGDDLVLYDALSNADGFFYTDSNSSEYLISTNFDGSIRSSYYNSAVEKVEIFGGYGNDGFNLDFVPSFVTISAYGGEGDDGFSSGFDNNGEGINFSENVRGKINFFGDGGTDYGRVFDGYRNSGSVSYNVSNNQFIAQSQTYSSVLGFDEGLESLSIAGGMLNSTYTINNGSSQTAVAITGGPRSDIFNIGSLSPGSSVHGGGDADTFNLGSSATPAATFGAASSIYGDGGANQLKLYLPSSPAELNGNTYGNLAFDQFNNFQAFPPTTPTSWTVNDLPAGLPLTVNSGSGGITINVDFTLHRGGRTTGSLIFYGGAAQDVINLIDSADAADTTWTSTASSIQRVDTPPEGQSPDLSTALSVFFSNTQFDQANISAGSGSDQFEFTGNPKLKTLHGGGGDDLFDFANMNLFQNITIDGDEGFDRVAATSTLTSSSSPTNGWGVDDTSFYNARIGGTSNYWTYNYANFEAIELHATAAANVANFFGIAATQTPLYLYGNASDDQFILQDDDGRTTGIRSLVQIQPIGGNDSLTISNYGDSDGVVAHLSDYDIGGAPGDTLFGPGGYVQAFSMAAINLNLGSGDDTVYARLSQTAATTIDAGSGDDSIGFALADAPNYAQDDAGDDSGQVTADGLATLSYSSFESSSIDDAAPQVLSMDFEYNAPQQSIDVQFSEDVSAALSTGLFKVTNVDTGEELSDGVMAVSYDADTNSAHLTFPGFDSGALPDGNYHATLFANVADVYGNVSAEPSDIDFFSLAGDANHDRKVDIVDLGILASNWQHAGTTFAQGDFNYDGKVDIVDLGILAAKWQSSLLDPSA